MSLSVFDTVMSHYIVWQSHEHHGLYIYIIEWALCRVINVHSQYCYSLSELHLLAYISSAIQNCKRRTRFVNIETLLSAPRKSFIYLLNQTIHRPPPFLLPSLCHCTDRSQKEYCMRILLITIFQSVWDSSSRYSKVYETPHHDIQYIMFILEISFCMYFGIFSCVRTDMCEN
jgi:hypothetical protein